MGSSKVPSVCHILATFKCGYGGIPLDEMGDRWEK